MAHADTNPDLLARRFRLANRVAVWRAQPGESAFQLAAMATFVGFGLWLADPLWTALFAAHAPWAGWLPATGLAIAVALALIVQADSARRRLAEQQRGDWLAAMPIAAATRSVARRRMVATRLVAQVALALALLLWAGLRVGSDAAPLAALLALGLLAGAAIGSRWRERRQPVQRLAPTARAVAVAVSIPAGAHGLRLLGAALEPAMARLPRSAPWVAGSFLLIPPSTPLLAIPALVLLFTALSTTLDLVVHWRQRYLADQAWLAAQPLAARHLLAAYVPYLIRRTLLWSLAFGGCMHALGAPALFALALTVALVALVADAVLCGFATRRQPQRFALLLALHGVILLATTQVLPPALPLIYVGCALGAWRRGLA